ncbi:hypothetical protein J2X28_002235 [Kocuria rhizophila]|nr:hypothetical protein [Kocuria rhizophila]
MFQPVSNGRVQEPVAGHGVEWRFSL